MKPCAATRAQAPGAVAASEPVSLEAARIARALRQRQRYRYVQPRIEATASGWKVFCRNCSRSVDAEGGEIAIAWLRRGGAGWGLYARDHAHARWTLRAHGLPLPALLALLAEDPNREFWP